MKSLFASFVALLSCLIPICAQADEGGAFRALLAAEWEYTMEQNPTWASALGDRRWNDRWPDQSLPALERRAQHQRELLEKLRAIDRAALPESERLNYDLFIYETRLSIEEHDRRLWTLAITQRDGIQLADDLADALRFETVKDYDDWIARLRTLPAQVEQNIAILRLGIAEKRTHAKAVLHAVPEQIAKQLPDKPEASPFFKPFTHFAADIPAPERDRLVAAAKEAIASCVIPAYRQFQDFFEKEYFPACTEAAGAWQWPDGEAAYAFTARMHTTTDLSPREIHEIGLREVDRITGEMQKVMAQVGWKGTRQEFFEHLRSDPKFYYKMGDELLAGYRAIAKRIDPLLVKLFKTLPRTPYGVEPIPENSAPSNTAAYYRQPAADGSRAGTFFANLYRPEMRPKHEMMALTLHEAVPGHHLQIALAYEQTELPNFRRYGGNYTAYVEGWGLYSESLGDELGLYDDPYSKFGQLTFEIWRACRLVIDTGIHSQRWTRQQAIDFLLDHSPKTRLDVENEVDRYISWPGQALAYKIGELRIKALRSKAKAALGDRFDVRAFHDQLLHTGPVPLEVLERGIDEWIAGLEAKG